MQTTSKHEEVASPRIFELSDIYWQLYLEKQNFEKICRNVDRSYVENKTLVDQDKNRFEGIFPSAAAIFSFPYTNIPRTKSNADTHKIKAYKMQEAESDEYDKVFPLLKINKIARELTEELKTYTLQKKYSVTGVKTSAGYTI